MLFFAVGYAGPEPYVFNKSKFNILGLKKINYSYSSPKNRGVDKFDTFSKKSFYKNYNRGGSFSKKRFKIKNIVFLFFFKK
jgi:hypothetical protein